MKLEQCWRSKRQGGTVRFQRVAAQPAMDDGTVLPDLPIAGKLTILAAKNDGEKVDPYDEEGRLWLRAYVINPEEIVESYMMRVSWDAFSGSIERFRERPRMLAHHNVSEPIGNWPDISLAPAGVTMRGFISGARPDMQRLALDGVLDVSAGFIIDEAEWNDDIEVLQVTKASLYETSLVSLPAVRSSFLEIVTQNRTMSSAIQEPERTVSMEPEDIGLGDALIAASSGLVSIGAVQAELCRSLGDALIAAGDGVGGRT